MILVDISERLKGLARRFLACVAVPVAVLVLGNASPALAEREHFALGAPQVVGLEEGRAFLRIDLPIDTLAARQAEIGEAILILRTAWARDNTCLMLTPFDFAAESVPAGDLFPHSTSAILSRRCCPVFRASPRGTYTVSLRALISSVLDGQCDGKSLLIGIAQGPDASTRLPEEVVEDLGQDASSLEARLDVFY